jgi:hypothetical protein
MAVRGKTPTDVGLALLPVLALLAPSSVVVGILITRFNSFRPTLWAGWATLTLAYGLALTWKSNTTAPVWIVVLLVSGLGHGSVLISQVMAAQAISLPQYQGAASAMSSFARGFGIALGVGVGNSIFRNVMKVKLRALGLPLWIADEAESYIPRLLAQPEGSAFIHLVKEAYLYGFKGVFGTFCAVAGMAGAASIFIERFDLNKELESEHTLQNTLWSKEQPSSEPEVV